MRILTVIALSLVALAALATEPATVLKYRDLQVYSTSVPAKKGATVTATTTFVNRGAAPLVLAAKLAAAPAAGFKGAAFTGTLKPGGTAAWRWTFAPPANLKRVVLAGEIRLNGQPERELFIAILGKDTNPRLAQGASVITERARVIATYAPRKLASITAEMAQRATQAPPPALTLGADGKTDYTIVLDSVTPDASLQDALADLQRCLQVMSGAEVPLAKTPAKYAIRLRQAELGDAAKGLHDAYRLATDKQDVVIEAANLDGLRNGVYGLLTDHLGCRWFQPHGLGEEIPTPADRTVRLPALNEVRGAVWFSAVGTTWGDSLRWDYQNRSRINGGRMNFGHYWQEYINKQEYAYDDTPEYYARDRQGKVRVNDTGESWTNFCSSNPDVIDTVAEKIDTFFEKRPNALVASISPNDFAPMCLCDRCLALDKQYGVTKTDGTQVADRLIHFSKEIYSRLSPENQQKDLGLIIYGYQTDLPKSAKPFPHMVGLICHMPVRFDHSRPWNDPTSPQNRSFFALLKGWRQLMPRLGFYDYYGHWKYWGPMGMVHNMREDLPAFHAMNGHFLVLECQPNYATQGLNHYIAARLTWDINADPDLLMEEFFQSYYGPAAALMRSYWLASERWCALERPGNQTQLRVGLRPEFWAELDGYLTKAQQAVAELPIEQSRFTDRVQAARDGFEYGRLRFAYDRQFGEVAGWQGSKVNHAAAIAFLEANREKINTWQRQYASSDKYWPTLTAKYLWMNVDDLITAHQEKLPPQ